MHHRDLDLDHVVDLLGAGLEQLALHASTLKSRVTMVSLEMMMVGVSREGACAGSAQVLARDAGQFEHRHLRLAKHREGRVGALRHRTGPRR